MPDLVRTARSLCHQQVSQRASEGETRLLRGLLGPAAESASEEQLVPLTPVMRLSQARGHLCAREFFLHEIHGCTSVRVGLHVCCFLRDEAYAAMGSRGSSCWFFRGRPRGRFRGITTPWRNSSPPQTPQGSRRSSAPSRHMDRTGQSRQSVLANSTSEGDSANHSSGLLARHGSSSSSTRPATSWRLPSEISCSAAPRLRSRTRWSYQSPPLDHFESDESPGDKKAADPCVGSAAWRLPMRVVKLRSVDSRRRDPENARVCRGRAKNETRCQRRDRARWPPRGRSYPGRTGGRKWA